MYKYSFDDNGFQNMFVYQPTLNTLELRVDKRFDVVGWKSKAVFNSKVALSNTAFLHNITLSEYAIGTLFNKSISVVEQKQLQEQSCKCLNYLWLRRLTKNFS